MLLPPAASRPARLTASTRPTVMVLMAFVPLVALATPAAATDHADVGELAAGQTGYGLSVFAGSEPDTFGVTILGVRRATRVAGDMIMVELSGQGLEHSAVAQGMSGSPVYLDDGRLIGAVAFGWPGALRPIAGLTPAAELHAAHARDVVAAAGPDAASDAATDIWMPDAPRDAMTTAALLGGVAGPRSLAARLLPGRVSAGFAGPRRMAADPWPEPAQLARQLLPGALSAGPAAGAFAVGSQPPPLPMGLFAVPTSASRAGGARAGVATGTLAQPGLASPPRLVPGSACAVALVSGDAQLGAMGTVSLVDGKRLVSMAHPFMQLGPVELPLAAAEVITVFPSREVSFKIGSAGALVGRITHDLRAGLAGEVGTDAPVTAVTADLALPSGGHRYEFAVARHPQLTPQLVFWCLYNALLAEGDDRSLQTVSYTLTLDVREADGEALAPIILRGATGGPSGVEELTADWQAPLQLLLTNRHAPLTIAGVQAQLTVTRPLQAATITGIRAPRLARPGETVTVAVELAERRGGVRTERFALTVPADTEPGVLRVAAGSAREFFQFDTLRAAGLFEDHDLGTLLALLDRPRSRSELTVALVAAEPGLTAAGRELSGLPPSVLRTLADAPPGAVTPTLARYADRDARPLDLLLQGSAVADLEIRIPTASRRDGERP